MRQHISFLMATLVLVASCESDTNQYDQGYEDGLASGSRVVCEGALLASAGDVNDPDYLAGYEAEYAAATEACDAEND